MAAQIYYCILKSKVMKKKNDKTFELIYRDFDTQYIATDGYFATLQNQSFRIKMI